MKQLELLKHNNKNSLEVTEEMLYLYPLNKKLIDEALETIKNDVYYNIIELWYFEKLTKIEIAFTYNTSVSTIYRNRKRLLIELTKKISPEKYILEVIDGMYRM